MSAGSAPAGTAPREPERVPAAGVPSRGHPCGTAGPPLPRLREVAELDALHPHDPSSPTAWIGSDVRQHTRDGCRLPAPTPGMLRSCANDATGHAARLAWADAHADDTLPGFGPESTGAYGAPGPAARHDAGRHVRVVNPARVQYAGRMRGPGNQTDRADAHLLAAYAQRERPPAWPPPTPNARALPAGVRRRHDLCQRPDPPARRDGWRPPA